jgi:hypothetical protein
MWAAASQLGPHFVSFLAQSHHPTAPHTAPHTARPAPTPPTIPTSSGASLYTPAPPPTLPPPGVRPGRFREGSVGSAGSVEAGVRPAATVVTTSARPTSPLTALRALAHDITRGLATARSDSPVHLWGVLRAVRPHAVAPEHRDRLRALADPLRAVDVAHLALSERAAFDNILHWVTRTLSA